MVLFPLQKWFVQVHISQWQVCSLFSPPKWSQTFIMTSTTEDMRVERKTVLRNAESSLKSMCHCYAVCIYYLAWNIVYEIKLFFEVLLKQFLLFSAEFRFLKTLWVIIILKVFQLKYKVVKYIIDLRANLRYRICNDSYFTSSSQTDPLAVRSLLTGKASRRPCNEVTSSALRTQHPPYLPDLVFCSVLCFLLSA